MCRWHCSVDAFFCRSLDSPAAAYRTRSGCASQGCFRRDRRRLPRRPLARPLDCPDRPRHRIADVYAVTKRSRSCGSWASRAILGRMHRCQTKSEILGSSYACGMWERLVRVADCVLVSSGLVEGWNGSSVAALMVRMVLKRACWRMANTSSSRSGWTVDKSESASSLLVFGQLRGDMDPCCAVVRLHRASIKKMECAVCRS